MNRRSTRRGRRAPLPALRAAEGNWPGGRPAAASVIIRTVTPHTGEDMHRRDMGRSWKRIVLSRDAVLKKWLADSTAKTAAVSQEVLRPDRSRCMTFETDFWQHFDQYLRLEENNGDNLVKHEWRYEHGC
jgi:hypothetical protein